MIFGSAHAAVAAAPATGQVALTASTRTAQAGIRASKSDSSLMAEAINTNNVAQARAILLRHGFTADQLQGASLVLVDSTHGGQGPQRVPSSGTTVTITCCPLWVTIKTSKPK